MSSDKSSMHDGIFQALAHRVRRDIIRVLAEKGPKTFTELMKDLGIEDSSVMAFHIKKLGNLIKKNEKGYYELTEIGWKAYRLLRELEIESVSDRLGKVIESKTKEVREEIEVGNEVTVANALEYRITKELVETLAKEGKKLNLKNIVLLVIDKDVDAEALKKVLGKVENVLDVEASEEVKRVVKEIGRGVSGFSIMLKSLLKELIPSIVVPLISFARFGTSLGLRRAIVKSSDVVAPTVIIDAIGSSIQLRNVEKGILFKGEGETGASIDFKEEREALKIRATGVSGVLSIPSKVETLVINVKGGDLRGEVELPKSSEFHLVGGDLEIRSKVRKLGSLKVSIGGGDAILEFDIDDVCESARIDLDIAGGDLEIKMTVPRDVLVDVKNVSAVGGDYVLNVPKVETVRKRIELNLRILGGDAKIDVMTK